MNKEETISELMKVAKMIGYGEIPPLQSNECFTAGAFDLIVFSSNDRVRNFELLTKICELYDEVKTDRKFLKGYLYLLDQLSYATDTTEKPKNMIRILRENREEAKSLQEWYREEIS